MTRTKTELEEWRDLFDLAGRFQSGSHWDHMTEDMIFAVKDPKINNVGYCFVMGEMGEHFALAVYRDLDKLIETRERSIDDHPDPFEMLQLQDCLMVSFEERKYLAKEDLDLIKDTGLRFRGKDSWIMFRDYKPEYVPVLPDKEGRDFLKICLEQTIIVADRARAGNIIFDKKEKVLTRVMGKSKGEMVWKDRYLEPDCRPPRPIRLGIPVWNFSERDIDKDKTFEISSFNIKAPVKDGKGRPYFAKALLIMLSRSGFILKMEMMHPKDYPQKAIEVMDEFFGTIGWLPYEILTDMPELRLILEHYLKETKVKIQMKEDLKAVKELKEGFDRDFLGVGIKKKMR
jgi:hypothetical protein